MILDCFTFFNELDLLEGRLEYLYDTVDYFIISETDTTHAGHPKPLNYLQNISRYGRFHDKIVYMPFAADRSQYDFSYKPLECEASAPQWRIENDQRNHISNALKLFPNDAVVIVSDLDEIPSIDAIKTAQNLLKINLQAFSLEQELFYYNLNQKLCNNWCGSVVTLNEFAIKMSPQWLRNMTMCGALPKIFKGGWHFSYWGSPSNITYKIQNFAHQELNKSEYTDVNLIKQRVQQGRDPYDRTGLQPIDPNTLPSDILRIFGKYVDNYKKLEHYCYNVFGWFSDADFSFYKYIIDQSPTTAHFVEIGSYKGRSSSFMAVEIANSGKTVKFDCVDTWEGSPEHNQGGVCEDQDVVHKKLFDIFLKNMEPVKEYYTPIRMPSTQAAATYLDQSLDWVFIDADHTYESVKADIQAWYPKIKSGGIISGHDCYHPPVQQVLREFFGPNVSIVGDCWYMKKQ